MYGGFDTTTRQRTSRNGREQRAVHEIDCAPAAMRGPPRRSSARRRVRRAKCRSRRRARNAPSVASASAMHPIRCPTSIATPPRSCPRSSSTRSTRCSVSGRGMSTRSSTSSVRWRNARAADGVGERRALRAPLDGELRAGAHRRRRPRRAPFVQRQNRGTSNSAATISRDSDTGSAIAALVEGARELLEPAARPCAPW